MIAVMSLELNYALFASCCISRSLTSVAGNMIWDQIERIKGTFGLMSKGDAYTVHRGMLLIILSLNSSVGVLLPIA